MDKTVATVLKIAVGAAILLYLINFVGIGKLYETLSGTRLAYLPLIVAVFIFSVAMRGLIFKVLLQPHESKDKKFGLARLAWISTVSWAAGMFTPGKLGEFSSVYLLKKEGLEIGTAAAVTLFNKLSVMATIGLFAAIGMLRFLGAKALLNSLILFVLILVAVTATALIPYIIFANDNIRKFVFGKFLTKYESQFTGFATEFTKYFTKKKILFYTLLINIAWIAFSSWLFVLAFSAVGQTVGFLDVVLVNSIGTTTSFIPITIGGTGLREASAIVFFGKLGISNAAILGSHIIIAAVSYTLAGIIALAVLLRKGR